MEKVEKTITINAPLEKVINYYTKEVNPMEKVEKTITISAPVEKVFNFIDGGVNLPEIWPSLVEVTDVKRLPNGGHTDKFVYKMAGIKLKGASEDIEYVPNQRIVTKTTGGAESTQTWQFEPAGGETKVTFTAEYIVPIPVLGKLAEAVIVKMNDREGDLVLANLKARMED
jgi:uncharacterized membrane protein